MLKFFSEKHISNLISLRPGETKLGEKIRFVTQLDNLQGETAQFVIFGVPEDVGVRANYGNAGTATAWNAFLKAFLNVQENGFNSGGDVVLLGEIDTSWVMQKAGNLDVDDPNYVQKLGDLVAQLDLTVSEVVEKVISAGKIPIVIGGGHNNAFGNIKGAATALKSKINVLNIDAHTDLRQLEHRHSGNGFSYAIKNGFLEKYSVFGLHGNYTPQYIFEEMKASGNFRFSLFGELQQENLVKEFQEHLEFVRPGKFGLEVDCDVMANFPSSAISPSGFSLDEVRNLVREAAKEKNCCYLHICEAIAAEHFPTGKALAFLVTDFIKERKNA